MYYVDSQRTLTRRESSLIADKTFSEGYDTGRTRSTTRFQSESNGSISARVSRPHGTVRKEIITSMFESMLDCIVDSWVIIPPAKPEETTNEMTKTPSEQTFASKKTKKGAKESAPPPSGKNSRTKRNRSSKLELLETQGPLYQCWWSSPDERAIIRFKNGNKYEGNISMKRMHGEGRFQWADGTVYLGQFKENEMHGKGVIQWKDDTWYQGDVVGNVRHGRGLYVNSRRMASYCGGWHCGTKHGKGVLNYPSLKTNNLYDGDWVYNVRHGYGIREYSYESGYKGDWERYVREGEGLMIWPDHDVYEGGWKNGVMSGHGLYIWNAYYNNTLTLPSLGAFNGLWQKGVRNGYGVVNFGLGLGSHYKGNFKNNKKHGPGKLVTNNGLIMRNNKTLFMDDILGTVISDDGEDQDASPTASVRQNVRLEPFHFDICDDTVGLIHHIEEALKNLDREAEIRSNLIDDYLENNKLAQSNITSPVQKDFKFPEITNNGYSLADTLHFEATSLQKSLRHYETDLKNIYYYYATVCNKEEVYFPPVLIRLFMWQFYYDCNMQEQGLSLVEIDRIFHACPDWLSRSPHDPFEKIYFWQFLHSIIAVASKLYARKQMPNVRPDTILSSAFRTFMEKDALPGCRRRKGLLVNGYGSFVPLKAAYELYRTLGEPHTVRTFLCATRRPPHCTYPQPALVEFPDDETPVGRNVYTFGSELAFVTDEPTSPHNEEFDDAVEMKLRKALKLFNFGNLSSKCIIKIFSHIFPQLCSNDRIMDLDIEMTFFEFFEAFVACSQKSIRVKEEEMRWKQKFYVSHTKIPSAPSPTPAATFKTHK